MKRLVAGVLLLAGVLGTAAPAAATRTSVVYDDGQAARRILFGSRSLPGLADIPYVLHQGPARGFLPRDRRAGKITSFAATPATRTVIGLDRAELLALVREEIARSPSHTVFLDELTADFRGETGVLMRSVLDALSNEPSPWGEESLARHVQVYVPTPSWMLHDAAGWADAWALLARSGGVWLETFRARDGVPIAWQPEEWLTFPRAVADRLAAVGGDLRRLHFLIGPGAQRAQWRLATTGENCAILANGPGAYRVGRNATAFVRQFRRAFGPSGLEQPTCLPSRPPTRQQLRALAWTLGLAKAARPPAGPGTRARQAPRRLSAHAARRAAGSRSARHRPSSRRAGRAVLAPGTAAPAHLRGRGRSRDERDRTGVGRGSGAARQRRGRARAAARRRGRQGQSRRPHGSGGRARIAFPRHRAGVDASARVTGDLGPERSPQPQGARPVPDGDDLRGRRRVTRPPIPVGGDGPPRTTKPRVSGGFESAPERT